MEAYGTYKELINIADQAAEVYKPQTDGCPESYAEWVVELYQTESCPEPIKSNDYHQILLKAYPSTIRRCIIARIENLTHAN